MLHGKHALVTGGSRGIGRGIVVKLAEEGVQVGIHYYRNETAAKETLERVRKHGAPMDSSYRRTSRDPRTFVGCSQS